MATNNLNLLAVSVGNTRTRLGTFVDGTLSESDTHDNSNKDQIRDSIDHAFSPLREQEDAVVLLSSVNPPMGMFIEETLEAMLKRPVLRLERDLNIPIGRQLDREALVGEDRLLNAAAAYDVLKQSCVVVDVGTATTIDFIDGQGTFHGGVIVPGAQLMLDSLTSRTALLPEVEFAKPTEPIGHNTTQAMLSGVYYGLRGIVREVVEQIAELAGAFPTVIATGGDANLIFRDFELIDRIVPDLTLRGLTVTLKKSLEQQDAQDDTPPTS